MGISCVTGPDEAAAYGAVATQRFLSSLKGSKSGLQQSRVAVTTMHQWQRSSSPNCKVVQRGAELLGLDCAAVGGGGVQDGGVASRQKSERYKWDDRGWGVAGTESRTEWRKGRAKLVPFSCQHISSHCLPPILFSKHFASHSPQPRWGFGPLVWKRYKATENPPAKSAILDLPKLPLYYFSSFIFG